jgi:uncharacterized YccA/Bax inhibitor family protein
MGNKFFKENPYIEKANKVSGYGDVYSDLEGGSGYDINAGVDSYTVLRNIIKKAFIYFLLIIGVGAVGVFLAMNASSEGLDTGLLGAYSIALILMVIAMVVQMFSIPGSLTCQVTSIIYCVGVGFVYGGLTYLIEYFVAPGAGLAAAISVLAIFAGALLVYSSGLVKVNSSFKRFALVFMFAFLIFSIIETILSITGVLLIEDVAIGGLIGIIVILLGSIMLIIDFDAIKTYSLRGVQNSGMEWYLAYSLIVTLVWIYIQLLRILSVFLRRK